MRLWRFSYPDSFFRLLLIGFALTVLPLLYAFGNAALHLDRLAEQSRSTVYHAVEATRASRQLAEHLAVMERSVRQYLVLGDATLLAHYRAARQDFASSAQALGRLPLAAQQRQHLQQLVEQEHALYAEITNPAAHDLEHTVASAFAILAQLAQSIVQANNQLIDREAERLARTAETTQHLLLWQLLPLLPVALLAAAAITYLLTRPIRRMDDAIRLLGRGEYTRPIAISGPGDIRLLGERLEWLRQQLLELDEQKQRFLRHVSHELKTPLTVIREGSELLAEEVGGRLTEQQKEIAGILRENGLRLQAMIEGLLDYTAAQYKVPELTLGPLHMKQLVEEVLAAHMLRINSKNIHTLASLTEHTLQGDREKIVTIVDNLLSNAIKFTPSGGTIGLRLTGNGDHVTLDIFDTGPGIAPEDRDHLFEPFYRGGGKHDGLIGGTGLGLSIAREYARAHGGDVTLQHSRQGARFRVSLPVHPKGNA